MRQYVLTGLVVAMLALTLTTDRAHAQRQRFDGHKVVRVELTEFEQLQMFRALVDGKTGAEPGRWDIWRPDDIHIGTVDVRVSPEQLRMLEATGLEFKIYIDDVQALVDESYGSGTTSSANWYEDYHPLTNPDPPHDGVFQRMQLLADTYPDLAEVIDLGPSLEDRPQLALLITGEGAGEDKPGFLLQGGIHAREWITVPVAMYTAEWMLTNYGSDPKATKLVDEIEWTILMVHNPDGYDYTWTTNRMWRKNRRDNGGGIFGVDLNRNYEYGWGGPGSSGDPSSQTYRGPSPFSEPESQNCRDYTLDHPNIAAFMDQHSYGQLIMWPWGYIPDLCPDNDEYDYVGSNMSRLVKEVHGMVYEYGPVNTTIYPASGVTIDWHYGEFMEERFVMAFTYELRDNGQHGFLLPPEQIIPNCEEILPATLFMAERVLLPVLRIDIDTELPRFVPPEEEARFEITVVERRGHSSGKAWLYYRTAPGDFTEVAMSPLGEGRFEGTIPGLPCGEQVEYYFLTTADDGTPFTNPANAPDELYKYKVGVLTEIIWDNFEEDLGWTAQNLGATSGDWQRGVPVNDPDWEYDPISDSDGSGKCYLTQNEMGNTDVDDGAVQLTSPIMDMSLGDIIISYDYYLYLTRPGDRTDRLQVLINSYGGQGGWKEIARHDTNGGLEWRYHEITQEDLEARGVEVTKEMVLRFIANDANRQSIVESALDAFKVFSVRCPGGEITCEDIKKFKAKCSGKGKLKVTVKMNDKSHHGQTVEIDINSEVIVLEINVKKARLKRLYQSGHKTITLTDPPDCFDPIEVDCP